MDSNGTGDLPPRRIAPIPRILSEPADGNRRIVIDRLAETVTFIGCHKKAPSSFFTLYRPRQTVSGHQISAVLASMAERNGRGLMVG